MKFHRLPYILAAVSLVQASNTAIRGVDPAKYDLYQPDKTGQWTCLDGSKIIPHSAINDDYCDCSDGSDEPGTSACPNFMFYCANKGHVPAYIKSYAVNDGVCDEACCDGSDEDGTLTTCPDRCQEVGEAHRLAQASLEASTQAGLLAKQKLIDEAQEQISRWQEEKVKVEDQLILKKSTLLKLQRDLEKLEKHKSKNKKCRSAASSVEIDTLKHDITILKKELASLVTILSEMKRDHNKNYHDLAVKGAVRKYDVFMDRYADIMSSIEEHLNEIGVEQNRDEVDNDGDDDDDDDNDDDSYDAVEDENFEKAAEAVQQDETGLKNQEVIDNARNLVNKAEEEVTQLNRDLEKVKENLDTDYGLEAEWLKLKDVCIEKDEGEYTYSLCFLGDAHQKSNKDSSRTFLGKFEKYDGGDGADKYKVHVHERGTRCWNGPLRSVRATIECGGENEIVEVTEPQKCEYHYHLKSPAVCQSPTSAAVQAATAAGVNEEVASKIVADEINKEREAHIDLNKKPAHEEL